MSEPFVAGQSALWVQVDGPNTEPAYLGCHQLEDIDEPRGDVELIYCPDESGQNKFKVSGSFQGAADSVTTSIITDVTEVCDYLEQIAENTVPIYINKAKTGRRDVFSNYIRMFILVNARITNITLSGLAGRTPDDQTRSEQTFELAAEQLIRIFTPVMSRQVVGSVEDMYNIVFCDDTCLTGFLAGDILSGSVSAEAQVYTTSNGGAAWSVCPAVPFDAGESIRGMTCFEMTATTSRVIISRGTTDALNPAEVAYTDDGGTTWVNVDVGAVNGAFANHQNALFSLDWVHVWLVTTGGFIYFSADGGATWSAQESGALTAQNLNAIHFADSTYGYAGGVANVIMKTATGGDSWELVTGPTAEAANAVTGITCLGKDDAWITYSSGRLYYTSDGGTTWTQRSFTNSGTGALAGVWFYNDLVGYIIHNSTAPLGTVLRTVNGGQAWEIITTTTNLGVNGLHICDPNKFSIAGNVQGGTAFVARAVGCV